MAGLGLEEEEQVAVRLQLAVIREEAIGLVCFLKMLCNLALLLLFVVVVIMYGRVLVVLCLCVCAFVCGRAISEINAILDGCAIGVVRACVVVLSC